MKSKTKIIAVATAALAGISLVGVGFASWVITGSTKKTVDGNINVEGVSDERVTISAGLVDENASVSYTLKQANGDGESYDTLGYYYSVNKDTDWLIQQKKEDEEEIKNENLVIFLKVEITAPNKDVFNGLDLSIGTANIDIEEDDDSSEDSFTSVSSGDANYISGDVKVEWAPADAEWEADNDDNKEWNDITNWNGGENSVVTVNNGSVKISKDDLTVPDTENTLYSTIYVKLTFAWGEYFKMEKAANGYSEDDIVNPGVYFNAKYGSASESVAENETKTAGDEANDVLSAIETALENVQYKVTVAHAAPAPAAEAQA